MKLTVRIRELSYAAAKAEFPDIPDAPISENEVSAWWKRINPSK